MIEDRYLRSAVYFAEQLVERMGQDDAIAAAVVVYGRYGIDADAIRDEWIRQLLHPGPRFAPGQFAQSASGDAGQNPESPRGASALVAGTT